MIRRVIVFTILAALTIPGSPVWATVPSLSPTGTAAWSTTDVTVTLQASGTGASGNRIQLITWSATGAQTFSGSKTFTSPFPPNPTVVLPTITAEGTSTISYSAKNVSGEITNAVYSVRVDKTPPTISAKINGDPINASTWYGGTLTITYSATDAISGVVAVSPTTTFTGVDSEFASVTATSTDGAGNTGSTTFTFKYDSTAPQININGVDDGDYANSAHFNITANDPNRPSAFLSTQAWLNDVKITDLTDINVILDGSYVLDVQSKDEAGNTSTKSISFTVDTIAPEITIGSIPADNGMYNVPQTLDYSIHDNHDLNPAFLVKSLLSKVDPNDIVKPADPGSLVSLEGLHILTLVGADGAGNQTSAKTLTFLLDYVAPTTTVTGTGFEGNSGWFRGDVTVSLGATDPNIRNGQDPVYGSGMKSITLSATGAHEIGEATVPYEAIQPFIITKEGITTIAVSGADNAGNTETTQLVVIKYDKTPPVITLPGNIVVPATNASGAVVTFDAPTATDLLDQNPSVSSTHLSGATFPIGTTTIVVTATDEAGNKSCDTFTVTVQDTVPPVISNVPDAITAEATNSNGAAVTFTLPTAEDNIDGPVVVVATETGNPVNSGDTFAIGPHTLDFRAVDAAGNETVEHMTITVRDTTAPVITVPIDITIAANSAAGAAVNYTVSALDAVDGAITPSASPASGSTFGPGSTTVTVTATDAHSNMATATFKVNVTFGWSGVLQPVNANGSSVFKLGSTVPVKFQLTGASAGITNGSFKLMVAKVSNSVVGTEVEATSTSAATTGNLFRYDATAGQYIFNLGTKGLTTGCYQLRIDLGDGSVNTVLISLK